MEQCISGIEKHCKGKGNTEFTTQQNKDDFARLWAELGEDVFDCSKLAGYLWQHAPSSKKKTINVVIAALQGSGASAVKINKLEQLKHVFRETAESKDEQARKMVEKQDKIDEVGDDFYEVMNRIIIEIEKKIALRKRHVTRKGKTFWQKIPDDSIVAYRSYIIDCKIRLQGPPPQTDFCNVFMRVKGRIMTARMGRSYLQVGSKIPTA